MLISRTLRTVCRQAHYFAQEFASSSHDAEDIAQTTLMKLCRDSQRIAAAIRCRSYLQIAVRNTAYDFYQQQRNYNKLISQHYSNNPLTSLAGVCEETAVYLPAQESDDVAAREKATAVVKALNNLSPSYREILKLVAGGLKYKDIAEYLDIPIGTARSRIHNARRQLLKVLG